MRTDTGGRQRPRMAPGFAAIGVLAASLMISTGTASPGVGPADLDLAKSVSQPTAEPGEDVIFFLSYSCSSLTVPCENATITDTLPPELSRAAADVQFGGNFANVDYNPATGTALFTLFTPLPAGTTAQASITAHFLAGTAPGTTATNQATMNATNAAPSQSNEVTVTAVAASPWSVTKGRVTSAAQLNTPFTYRVAITLAAGGTQNIDNARFVDTLPPGAQFVSATQGGVFDAGTNTVTWQVGTLIPNANNDVTTSREVTVIFPSPPFQAGDQPVNNVEALGAPTGEADQSLGQASFPVTLRAAGDITGASKSDTLDSLGPGQSDTYTITGSNPNAGPLDSFTILENLPVALSMVQDGVPNLTGTGTAPLVSWRPLGGGSFQPIGTSPSGGGWGATVPANADEMQLAYGTLPATFSATAQVRGGVPANSIGRDGVPLAAAAIIRNCITVSGSSGGTAAIPRSSCTDQTVAAVPVNEAPFTVHKDFTDDNTATVPITLDCTDGNVTNSPQNASDEDNPNGTPATFAIEAFADEATTTCTATETTPTGYTGSGTPPGTCTATLTTAQCTITDTAERPGVDPSDSGPDALARTGAFALPALVAGGLSILGGLGLQTAGRRRRLRSR